LYPQILHKISKTSLWTEPNKGKKNKEIEKKRCSIFLRSLFPLGRLGNTGRKPRSSRKTKTRRKTSHSKSLQRMTWFEDFGKTISRTKIFPKKFPNFSFANKSREKEFRELQEMKLSIYKIGLIH
jgi:hypothetical protein